MAVRIAFALFGVAACALTLGVAPARADEVPTFELVLKDHAFAPANLVVPADRRIKLVVKNQDSTLAEFESHDFRAEKVVGPGSEVSLLIGPLQAGQYRFYDEFHEDKAQGTLTAQ